jgi:LacI family transcriptional regulator
LKERRHVTIGDVAREARVGTTTVSRVINGGKLVAPVVRMRVEKVISQLGFQPNHAARSLAQERSQTIGLIVPRLTDPFFSTIASVAQQVCRDHQHTLLISTSEDLEEQALEELRAFERQRVDGLIIVPPANYSSLFQDYCQQFSKRAVAVDMPIRAADTSSVLTDNVEATANATEHLIGHDRNRILFLASDPELHTMQERRRGYSQALARHKLKPIIQENIHSFASAEDAIMRAYRNGIGIDGLLAANSTLGIYAFQVLQKRRISVPARVSFITFDDFALADTLRPPVTCVAQPVQELAKVATQLLFTQLGLSQPRTRKIELSSQLIIRASCGCKARLVASS